MYLVWLDGFYSVPGMGQVVPIDMVRRVYGVPSMVRWDLRCTGYG